AIQYAHKSEKIRGVNLGGCLFKQFKLQDQVVDEFTFTKFLGHDEAKRQLHDHWSSWVTEQDIKKLASYGLNHLRIPVGYWSFEKKSTEPFIMDGFHYLLKAVRWAKKYGMKVIIDLHGAPGSQNGFDNSGKRGPIEWQTGDNIQRTLNVIKNITETFSRPEFRNTVTIIGVLNEPKSLVKNQYNKYFKEAYKIIRDKNNDILILYDSTFLQVDDSIKFLESFEFKKIALDTHIYNAFNCNFVSMSISDQFTNVCSNYYNISSTSQDVLRFVGEWSLATTDCTWLWGYSSRCNYPSNTCQAQDDYLNWTSEYKSFLKQYASAQMDAYEAGIGWIFWTFKTESSVHWNFALGIEQGWIPLTYKQRTYDYQSFINDYYVYDSYTDSYDNPHNNKSDNLENNESSQAETVIRIIKYAKGLTSSLKKHLTTRKEKVPELDKGKSNITIVDMLKNQSSVNNCSRESFNLTHFKNLIKHWIVKHNQPFYIIEDDDFKKIFLYLETNAIVPSADLVRRHITNDFKKECNKLYKKLQKSLKNFQ
ncbi:20852_t:CDS:2, partial [Cetraspora pellucida]